MNQVLRGTAPRVGVAPGGIAWAPLAITALGAAAAAYVAVTMPDLYRATLAGAIGVNLIVLGMRWPRAAAVATLLFVPFLALIRRLLISDTGWVANDPLLLVGPVVALFLLYRLYILEDRGLDRDLLARLVLILLAFVVIEAFNPTGAGGLIASLGGLIFLGVPLLWFFIGRQVADRRTISILLYAVLVVAILVAAYGLFQTEFAPGERLPSWDQSWYETAGYSALNVGESGKQIRPFSTFSSNLEYSVFLSVALMIIFALVFHWRLLAVLLVPALAFALFSSGGRSGMAVTGLGIVILLGARTRSLAVGLVVIVLGVGAVYGLAAAVGPRLDRAAGLSGDDISERNVSGLLHPLDPGQSSALSHWDNLEKNVVDGFQNPAGSGTASANAAGRNLANSGGAGRQTDNDVADVFLSLGAAGGLLYLTIMFFALRAVFSRYSREKDWMLFAVAGVLVVMVGNWLNGALYSLAPLTWFLLGWASRPSPAQEAEEQDEPDASARLQTFLRRLGGRRPARA